MFAVTVSFRIAQEHAHEFNALVRSNAATSLATEEGCHRFDVCGSSEDAQSVFLYELYSDAEAFDVHLASTHFKAFDAKITDMVLSKDVHTFDEVWT